MPEEQACPLEAFSTAILCRTYIVLLTRCFTRCRSLLRASWIRPCAVSVTTVVGDREPHLGDDAGPAVVAMLAVDMARVGRPHAGLAGEVPHPGRAGRSRRALGQRRADAVEPGHQREQRGSSRGRQSRAGRLARASPCAIDAQTRRSAVSPHPSACGRSIRGARSVALRPNAVDRGRGAAAMLARTAQARARRRQRIGCVLHSRVLFVRIWTPLSVGISEEQEQPSRPGAHRMRLFRRRGAVAVPPGGGR